MSDPVALVARQAAKKLAPHAPGVRSDVEAALDRRSSGQYLDPVSLGALVVSAAQLAWTIHRDRERKAPPDVIAHEVRVRLEAPADVTTEVRNRLVEAVVLETVVAAEQGH